MFSITHKVANGAQTEDGMMNKDLPKPVLASLVRGYIGVGRWSNRDPQYKKDPLRLMPYTIAATWEYWQSPRCLWESIDHLMSGGWSL